MGGDNRTSGSSRWGFTGGYLAPEHPLRTDGNSFDLTGWNAGLYAGYDKHGFFVNGIAKGDIYKLKADLRTAGPMIPSRAAPGARGRRPASASAGRTSTSSPSPA